MKSNATKSVAIDPKQEKNSSLFASIIVPTYQEADNLRSLIIKISSVMSQLDRLYEVLVVDDDSQDGSDLLIEKLADEGYPVRIIVRDGERGLSSAVLCGFEETQSKYLVCMDADLSHSPETIPRLLACFKDGKTDFAIGSRYVPGGRTEETWGMFRWLNSKVATLLAKPFTIVKDPMSGFFAIPREVFERAKGLSPIGYKIGLELIVKCSCMRISEVPINFANRKYGESKLNFKEQLNYLKHLKRLTDFKFGEFSRIIQFCLVGSTGMIVDLITYSILLYSTIAWILARAIAIWVAMTWNFWLNRRLTFSYSQKDKIHKQYTRFVVSCGIGGLISWSIAVMLPSQISIFSGHLLLAAIIGIFSGTIFNYILSRYWVFKKLSPMSKLPE